MKACIWKTGLAVLALGMVSAACEVEPERKTGTNSGHQWSDDSGDPIATDWDDLTMQSGNVIDIDPGTAFQVTNGFGASDCWDGNWVGQFWDADKREQIAEWLFSQEFDSGGNPKGIGLSQWRVNMGAGSWEQGLNSEGVPHSPSSAKLGDRNFNINNQEGRWDRRAESFLKNINNPDEGYDWDKQKGQQYFFKKAKDMGTEILIAFSNSPPVPWTKSGTANNINPSSSMGSDGKYTSRGNDANLKDDAYDDFAGYLADVAEHFAAEGYPFDFISPVNEPQWTWNEDKQEGSPWTNANITQLVKELDTAIRAREGIKNKTKIMISEAAQWDMVYSQMSSYNNRSNQIDAFFNPANTATYVGNLLTVQPNIIAAHTYFTHPNDTTMKNHRVNVKTKADAVGAEVYSTEWCVLGSGDGLDANNCSYWDVALFMAKLTHCDITLANAVSWSFWTAMDVEGTSKDKYSLIGIAPGVETYDPNSYQNYPVKASGSLKAHATLWAMGNYSLFVRPGFQRISLVGAGVNTNNGDGGVTPANYTGLMGTAYKSPAGYKDKDGRDIDRVVAVWVNMSTTAYTLASKFGDNRLPRYIRCYRSDSSTTGGESGGGLGLRKEGHTTGIFTVPPKSVYTVVYDF
jgi:O-glycosyl hydrolase